MSSGAVSDRISSGLAKLLSEGHRVIWWSDPEGEFLDALDAINLYGAELVPVQDRPALAIKRRIELDAGSPVVLYESRPAPEPDDDWLLDVRLYAAAFAADATSMLQQDLGLRSASLRDHLKARARFFASKERRARLASMLSPDDRERDVDAKIWAALARSSSADAFTILMDLLCDVAMLPEGAAAEEAPLWQELLKYGLEEFAWGLIATQFGYRETNPSLSRLLPRLFITDLGHGLHVDLPVALAKLTLPAARAASVAVFLSQWRDSTTRQKAYDRLSAKVAAELQIASHLAAFKPDQLGVCATFVDVERVAANGLRDLLLENKAQAVAADVRRIATGRMEGFWANARYPDTDVGRRSLWNSYYKALLAATDLFSTIDSLGNRLSFVSASAAYNSYKNHLYVVDQLYRQFHEAADVVSGRYPDAMAPLDEQVENRYLNGYLSKLAGQWDAHLDNGLLQNWTIDGVGRQQDFYQGVVQRYLDGGDDRRMFVIISDALRYEVAEELKSLINSRERVEARLDSMLGVVPSYTKLGMASLLPHQHLRYTDKASVLADGRSTDGLESRAKILAGVDGLAVKSEALAHLGKQALRDLFRPHRVVYIYHNTIDATGDSAGTESNTWVACRQAINELSDIVSRLANSASATAICITADHGFLFRETSPEALEKSAIGKNPAGTIWAKKRYLIGRGLGAAEYAHHGCTADTAGTDCDTEFWLPRGIGCFHFVGGARFVHGGASLQEVVVPLIQIRQKYGKSAERTKIRRVGANVLGQQHRITTNRHVFTLLQTEAVSERVRPCTVSIVLENQDGAAVSSQAQVRLDSESQDLSQRQHKVPISLLAQAVRASDDHYLVLADGDLDIELQRIPVRIDLAIENDFDF